MKKQDFLNPKSMITPGVAGGIVMLITNSLIGQFDLSGPKVALGLSFLVGTLVFLAKTVPPWQRVIYYVLNSLIIFATATGTAFVGNKAETRMTPASIAEAPQVASGADEAPIKADQPSVSKGVARSLAYRSQIETKDIIENGSVTNVVVTNQPPMVLKTSKTRYPAAGFFKKW